MAVDVNENNIVTMLLLPVTSIVIGYCGNLINTTNNTAGFNGPVISKQNRNCILVPFRYTRNALIGYFVTREETGPWVAQYCLIIKKTLFSNVMACS